ncbi:hypothetical protein MBM09_08310 [Flaviramulus sp. BrNp1-15]|uniref:hypothetical protein n=1 Tax=Flaviramulus sp. BrNp1-15 TaxID=2916754 RepID=UPI001EE98581|nr:hypothetical protein [Flaviramulus sp. BrNp1-15]ULC57922.1 hypothetical protein MBM09_08310 [Flaviramulus sp. BrNp1-15]
MIKSDGTLSQIDSNESTIDCTWSLKDDGKVLEVVYPDGLVNLENIALLTENKLVLVPKDTENGKLFFPQWYFTKN